VYLLHVSLPEKAVDAQRETPVGVDCVALGLGDRATRQVEVSALRAT
jgi:hypothetical protein